MTRDDIKALLETAPFTPLELHTSDGRSYVVPHPECALLTKTKLVLNIDDQLIIVSLLHVTSAAQAA